MKNIEDLQHIYMLRQFGKVDREALVQWAVEWLVMGEDENDSEIILLSSSISSEEIDQLAEIVLRRYLSDEQRSEEYWAGKYIVKLFKMYHKKEISISDLDNILCSVYNGIGNPSWLVMLSRNCEYATDISNFEQPFIEEFEYIASLWSDAINVEDFYKRYDRSISNSHDIKSC